MTTPPSQTSPLTEAYDTAIGGDPRPLRLLLSRVSGLPGPRINENFLEAFVEESRSRGAAADGVLRALAALDADEAPGGSALEFLPVCGVAGLAARGASDDRIAPAVLAMLHDAAEDFRFRVRDAVVAGLVRFGARRGESLVLELSPWMDGFFHAAAVVRALGEPAWLTQLASPVAPLERLAEAFILARDAPRSTVRYPGHKALVEALATTPRALAERFGVPVFDLLERWAAEKEPFLREIVEKGIGGSRLAGRFATDVARVKAALATSAKGRRDPRSDVGPTRGRGKRRAR